MSEQQTLWGTPSATSLPGSEDGASPCDSPDGQTMSQSGPDPVLASHSRPPVSKPKKKTHVTSGRISFASSPSQDLTSALASRLLERLDCDGSPEYTLTWKQSRIASGLLSYALRAKARPISGSGLGGWPTPCEDNANNAGGPSRPRGAMNGGYQDLNVVASLAGWPALNAMEGGQTSRSGNCKGELLMGGLVGWSTPRAEDAESAGMPHSRGVADTLTAQTQLAGWARPTARDHFPAHTQEYVDEKKAQGHGMVNLNDQAVLLAGYPSPAARDYRHANSKPYSERGGGKKGEQLPNLVAHVFGMTTTSSPVSTEKRGALKPEHSRWLMGYPPGWDDLGVTAMLSCRPLQRSSSKRTSKSNK